jgi:hypothetical protein
MRRPVSAIFACARRPSVALRATTFPISQLLLNESPARAGAAKSVRRNPA